jgi:hypothetical protein
MTIPAFASRWTAIAIAAAAVLDPSIPFPTRARPALRVQGGPADVKAAVAQKLSDAGFALHEAQNEAATVFIGAAPVWAVHEPPLRRLPLEAPVWVLDTTPMGPNVRVIQATGPAVRLPGQSIDVRVALDARGVGGKTSEIVLEDAGIRVASVRHEWKTDHERWRGSLQYLPPGAAAGRLRIKAIEIPGETSPDDNQAEIAVPPMRGGIRTLVVEAGVTWPAMFVRRAIEGDPAFAVAALQRASARIATRAGAPPTALTRGSLAPFEVALVGAPANLPAADVDALRWFVEERGGIAVLVPDQPPSGRYLELLGAPQFEPRALETAAPLGQGLLASEFVVSRRLPPAARVLAETERGEPVVFSARRGEGAVVFSGALDAWRYRAAQAQGDRGSGIGDPEAFAEFWRRIIVEEAATVPPVLEVSVDSSLVAVGSAARVRARLRTTKLFSASSVVSSRSLIPDPPSPIPDSRSPTIDLPLVAARAVSPRARVDIPVRLWPTAEPGVYEGEWRPTVSGDYDLAVTAGPHRGDAAATVVDSASPPADPEALALVARASGGRVFRADQTGVLVEEMKKAFPPRTITKTMKVMRSPWWVVAFAGLLCVEWAIRRRRGTP